MADDTNLDWDFGSSPNVFTVGGRTLVGIGQKAHLHGVRREDGTDRVQRQTSIAQHNGGSMASVGSAYDGHRL